MPPLKRLAALLLAATLTGCAHAPPVQFFTLVAAPGVPQTRYTGTAQVTAVRIPAALDRTQLVREASTARVEMDDGAQWAAPLEQLIADALTQDLQQRLGANHVLAPSAVGADETVHIRLDLLRFAPTPDKAVVLDGSYSFLHAGQVIHQAPLHVEIPTSAGDSSAQTQAQAMSAALGAVAERIAQQLVNR
ncbi:MAG: membrane integrity-associated transporter subunit PqiC [Nevskiaceae bacterium]|nr:MAG: membrane integrity-associated transporter subunit PqiC [Nevskiaceae bacterium]TBR74041.1 MAG: membrane integrity-associated transporter subunit PqiC [Nevskiaceae bacterium]